jgi:hypothetical protein
MFYDALYIYLRFEVFTSVVMNSSSFWGITLYSPLKLQNFYLQCRRMNEARNQHGVFYLLHASFLLCLFYEIEDGSDILFRNVG